MKTIPTLLLVVLVSLCIGSCNDGKKKSQDAENTFTEIHVEGKYAVRMPKTMQKTTGLNSSASLQYQNVHDEMYTIVLDEPKKEFMDALKEFGYGESPNIALYRDIQLERLSERMHISHQSDPTPMTISGLEAETIEIDAKVDNIAEELSYFLTFLDGEDSIYTIMSWTLKSKKQEHKKTFETIAQSFEVKD